MIIGRLSVTTHTRIKKLLVTTHTSIKMRLLMLLIRISTSSWMSAKDTRNNNSNNSHNKISITHLLQIRDILEVQLDIVLAVVQRIIICRYIQILSNPSNKTTCTHRPVADMYQVTRLSAFSIKRTILFC